MREEVIEGGTALGLPRAAESFAGGGGGSVSPKGPSAVGKALYGLLFTVALPALLIFWAARTEASVPLPSVGSPYAGAALVLVGAALMFSGMAALFVHGGGLPMNAYPPARHVTRGVYRLTSHPIYTGFALVCVGCALAWDSASGLWLVSPVVMLASVALVQGFERHDLRRRFGDALESPLIRLARDESARPSLPERLSAYVLVLFPWLVLYEAVRFLGVPRDAFVAFLPFERRLPVYEWTELIYASTYAFVLLAPLAARTRRDLRRFSVSGLVATGLITLLFLTVPLVAPPRPFEPRGPLGNLLMWERALDTPAAAFPSFHVLWALLAARVYAARSRRLKLVWWGWAALISLSCVTTGMHALVDVAGALVVFLFVTRLPVVWEFVRGLTERVANSWKEWRVGPVRVINHGFYAAAAAFVALALTGTLAGADYAVAAVVVASCVVITSAVWGQLVEGSPRLLRPFGWYGGLLGACVGVAIGKVLGADPWLLAGAYCAAAPSLQALGRLRCLVQGCCHGRVAPGAVGVRYTHPRSRVCRLSSLAGAPLHATPLYSILCNAFVAVVLLRLWQLHAALSLVVGVYLILSGLGRFVEESYRGEPQTATKAGLKLYQWLAVLSVLAGVLITTLGGAPPAPGPQFNWESLIWAACFAPLAGFALGVDFPDSDRRFARLA